MGTSLGWLAGLLAQVAAASGPFTEPEDCLVMPAAAAGGESRAASVNLGRPAAEAEKGACGLEPCGASRSTGDIKRMTFSLEASRTRACLMADSAADSDRTGLTQPASEAAAWHKPASCRLLLPADSRLAEAAACLGIGSGLEAASDSGLPRSGDEPTATKCCKLLAPCSTDPAGAADAGAA